MNMTTVYIVLSVCVAMTAASLLLVRAEFRRTGKMLRALKQEWDSAEGLFDTLAGEARDQLGRLATNSPTPRPNTTVTSDVRSSVRSMSKRGLSVTEISRTIGLPEGEVEVLLGCARL